MDPSAFTLDDEELPDVSIDLTPHPEDGSAAAGRQSLDGEWLFAAAPDDAPPPERSEGPERSEQADWRRHEVPGQWQHEGYEVAADERGWYRREFRVPLDWGESESRVKLRFDAVCTGADVWVNGERVGGHEGAFTPFELDVTDAVHPGDGNVVAVGASESSRAAEAGLSALGGGIARGVTLLGVPPCHVSDLDVETTLADDGTQATVRLRATVRNGSSHPVDDGTVRIALSDPDGDEVASVDSDVPPIDPGHETVVEEEINLEEFEAWTPEQPRLYDLDGELRAGGERERVRERVGIREVAVEGDRLLLNGEPVTLRGVNWREAHPDRGLAVPPALARRDAEALRAANVNYVRTSHNPLSEAFVEACDELGIVVELEAPMAGVRFENAHLATDPAYREVICRQTLEAVERDKNHPSVCVWSLANESDWGPNFEASARLVKRADPTRPITFNWGMYLDDDAPFCEIANHHYPALRDSQVSLDDLSDVDRPVLFGEFAHLYCYDGDELGADPGLRDGYARVLEAGWAAVEAVDGFAGAAIWAGLDSTSSGFRWGLFDPHRRQRPEYWHVKKVYSPVSLASAARGDDGTVTVELANEGTFADLSERTIEWQATGEAGTLDVVAAPGETGEASFDAPPDATEIELSVRHPRGFTIDEFVLRTAEPTADRKPDAPVGPVAATGTEAEAEITEDETEIIVERDGTTLAVDRNAGEITVAGPDGEPVIDGLPGVVATPQQSETSIPPTYGGATEHRLHPWRCEDVCVLAEGTGVEIRGGYYYDTIDVATGSFAFALGEGGTLHVDYDFELAGGRTIRETGVVLPVVGDCDALSWRRESRWTAYPDDHVGRAAGTADAFPGERPDTGGEELDSTRPWATEATRRGSNDFRSTKRNVHEARLAADDGRGVAVFGDGDRHVRCSVAGDAVDLLVLDRSLAGVGLSLLDRHELLGEEPAMEAGDRITGSATLRVVGPDRG